MRGFIEGFCLIGKAFNETVHLLIKWIQSVWWRDGYLRIFTLAFLLLLAPTDLWFTLACLTQKKHIKSYCQNKKKPVTPLNRPGTIKYDMKGVYFIIEIKRVRIINKHIVSNYFILLNQYLTGVIIEFRLPNFGWNSCLE